MRYPEAFWVGDTGFRLEQQYHEDYRISPSFSPCFEVIKSLVVLPTVHRMVKVGAL